MTGAAGTRPARVQVYASRLCPYCVWARQLLGSRGIAYELMDVDRNPQLWADMEARSGRRTVPQIFVDDQAIGGYEDLSALDSRGELQRMLGPQAPEASRCVGPDSGSAPSIDAIRRPPGRSAG